MRTTTLWILYDPGGRDDPAEVYGVFTSEDKARRAADLCDRDGQGGWLSIDPVQIDGLYIGEMKRTGPSANVFSYPQPEPDVAWDHVVVDGLPDRLAIADTP
jgi:hypothetical protein